MQKTITTLIDDVTGESADETVTFSVDGVDYVIDLTTGHANELRDALAEWVSHARKKPHTNRTRASSTRRADLADVRAWARNNGHKIADRGRVPADVLAAYDNRAAA